MLWLREAHTRLYLIGWQRKVRRCVPRKIIFKLSKGRGF